MTVAGMKERLKFLEMEKMKAVAQANVIAGQVLELQNLIGAFENSTSESKDETPTLPTGRPAPLSSPTLRATN